MRTATLPSAFEFTAPVLFDPEVDDGYMKHFIPIPDAVARSLDAAGAVRLAGTLDDRTFRRAMHRRPDGSRCLKFGQAWLREAGLFDGAEVHVTLGPDPDPDHVDLPDELAAALQADPEATAAWQSLTPGRQRTLAYGVTRAKRPATRQRRAAAVLEEVVRLVEDRG